jgi:hypothetical protein
VIFREVANVLIFRPAGAWFIFLIANPRLKPWAAFVRRFAAGKLHDRMHSSATDFYLMSLIASSVPKSWPDGSTARATTPANASLNSGYFATKALITATLF